MAMSRSSASGSPAELTAERREVEDGAHFRASDSPNTAATASGLSKQPLWLAMMENCRSSELRESAGGEKPASASEDGHLALLIAESVTPRAPTSLIVDRPRVRSA